jgi:uncharacterized protein HemX
VARTQRHLAEVEYRANTLYEQEAKAAVNERHKTNVIINEAQTELRNKHEITKGFETEIIRLRRELESSNKKIAEEQEKNKTFMTEGA